MLQKKLVIAMCAALALSACGGEDNDDQSKIVLNPPEDINAPEEEEEQEQEEEEEPEEEETPAEWLSVTFEEETDVETWQTNCVSSECNATATLAYNADAQAMDVTPEFLTAGDQIEIFTSIDPAIDDMTGGNAHLNLYVPEAYAGMVAQIFFQDASDRKGYIGYTNATAGWNTFSVESLEAGTGVDSDYGDFGYHNEGFDLTLINRMGVQIQSAEGFPDAQGTLHIDDAIVSPEAIEVAEKVVEEEEPAEPVVLEPLATGDESFTFTSDVQGWGNDSSSGSTVTHDTDAEALVITPDWENADEGGNRPKAMGVTTNVISNATVRMIVTLTQAQIDGGIGVQPYIQQNAGAYQQAFGPIITEGLVAGDNAITYEAAELTDAMRIGVQLVGPITGGESDVVLIKQVEVDLPGSGMEEPSAEIVYPFTDGITGWYVNGQGAGTQSTANIDLTHDDANGALVMTPKDWSANNWELQARTDLSEAANMTGSSVNMTVNLPQSYITDGGLNLQLIVEHEGGSMYGDYIGLSGLTEGDNEISVDLSSKGDLIGATKVGVQFATPPTDTSILDPIAVKHLEIDLADAL